MVEKATYWLWEHQWGPPLVSPFSNFLHCHWGFKGPHKQKHSQQGSPRHKRIGWGDCHIDCQMGASVGQSQTYYEMGLFARVGEVLSVHLEAKTRLWLIVSVCPFVSAGW